MIGAAAFKPMRTRVGRHIVSLARGQFAFAERFMAQKFGWSKSSVHRFLGRLESEAMVVRKVDRDLAVVTICNYDKYAFDTSNSWTATEPRSEPPANRQGTKEEQLKEGDGGGDAAIRAKSFEIASRIESLCGYPDPTNMPPAFCGTPNLVEKWLRGGWQEPVIIAAVQEALARKKDGPPDSPNYFEKPIARAHARQAAPLPIIETSKAAEVLHEKPRGNPGAGSSWQASRDRFREAHAELGRALAATEGEGEERSDGGAQVIRLAPTAGRG